MNILDRIALNRAMIYIGNLILDIIKLLLGDNKQPKVPEETKPEDHPARPKILPWRKKKDKK